MGGGWRTLRAAALFAWGASAASAQELRVTGSGPGGEIAKLEEAREVRVVFSEPMVALGRIPAEVRAPFFRISPAVPGRFRWSGTSTLIFTPSDPLRLPYATRFELVAAYAALARGGLHQHPRLLRRVVAADGTAVEAAVAPLARIVSARAAFWVTDVLADPRARAWAFGSGGSLDFPFPVAVKTGTSQSYRDNWTVGYTRAVTVGVWVGNFDRQELRNSSGVTGAAPIFHDVLLAAQARVAGRLPDVADPKVVDPVAELAAVRICALSGLHAAAACPAADVEWLPQDARPASCTWHRHRGDRVAVSVPAVYESWGRARGLVSDEQPASPQGMLRIVNPPDGAVYLRDPTLRGEFQSLALRAMAASPESVLRWEVDGQPVGTSRSGALDWPLRTGTHTIVVSDAQGQQDRTTIVVR